MSASETNNASEETLHAPASQAAQQSIDANPEIKKYDAEIDASLSPLRDPLVTRNSEASSARTIRDDTAGLDKDKGGSNEDVRQGPSRSSSSSPPHRPGLLERTTSGHTRGQKREDGKVELREKEVYDQLGFRFPSKKKWTILSVSFDIAALVPE